MLSSRGPTAKDPQGALALKNVARGICFSVPPHATAVSKCRHPEVAAATEGCAFRFRSQQLAMLLSSCEDSYVFPPWRYGVRVSTRPSQGRNPGSNPGIATNPPLFIGFLACRYKRGISFNPQKWPEFFLASIKRQGTNYG